MSFKSKKIGFQFFAEPGDNQNNPVNNSGNNQNNPGANNNPDNGGAAKTFTQAQVNAMTANEKRTARQALLKELGFEITDDQSYKQAIESAKQTLDSTRSQAEKDSTARKNAETAQQEAETKATRLEMQVEALKAGVNPDYLDDVITLAATKVSETNPLSKVMEDMKTKYPTFFGSSAADGTGSSPNNNRMQAPKGAEGIGKRLAAGTKTTKKSSYFSK